MVSSRSGRPWRKFSALATSMNGKSERTSSSRGSGDALHGMMEIVDGVAGVAGCIFDGAADEASRLCRQANGFGGSFRTVPIAIFEVGSNGKRGGFDDGACVGEGFVATHGSRAIAAAQSEGESGAGGGKGGESESGEEAGSPGVPRIGDDQHFRALMKGEELRGFFGLSWQTVSFPHFRFPGAAQSHRRMIKGEHDENG